MDYCYISFQKAPVIAFAHAYKADKYRWFMPKKSGLIEITYIDQGDATKIYPDGTEKYFKAPCFVINMYNRDIKLRSDVFHSHYTAGFFLEYNLISVTQRPPHLPRCEMHSSPRHELRAVLPEHYRVNKESDRIKALMFRLIKNHELPSVWTAARSSALILSIISDLSALCMEDPAIYGGGYEPGVQRYYNKAAEYISANLDKKISVEEIAAHTGISSGYLSRLFKEFSGRTIVDYINYLKIEKVKELMGTMNLSLRQAGESVGIGDHNYLSRLFKKYTKLSVREYNLHDISAIAPEVI